MRRDLGQPALTLFLRIVGAGLVSAGWDWGMQLPLGQVGRVTPPSSVPGTI